MSVALGRLSVRAHVQRLREETDAVRSLLPPGMTSTTVYKSGVLTEGVVNLSEQLSAEGVEAVLLSLGALLRDVRRLRGMLEAAPIRPCDCGEPHT